MRKTLWAVLISVLVCIISLSACDNSSANDSNNANVMDNATNTGSHIHSFDGWETIKSSTCTSDGVQERYCSCGEKQTRTLAKENHSFGEWKATKNATCTVTGMEERRCSCGETEKRSINTVPCKEKNGLCAMCGKTMNPFNALKHYVITNGSTLSSGYEYLYTDNKQYTISPSV